MLKELGDVSLCMGEKWDEPIEISRLDVVMSNGWTSVDKLNPSYQSVVWLGPSLSGGHRWLGSFK